MPKKQYLEAGEIVGTHGIHGELRIQPWCDSPATLAKLKTLYFDEGKKAVSLTCRAHKNIVLAVMEGVNSVQEADAMRGRVLWLNRDDLKLDNGQYFIQDLIGLRVVDSASGEEYGTLSDISATGANDVYHVRSTAAGGTASERLIPAIPDVIAETDIDGGILKVKTDIIKGLFHDED